MTEVAAKPEQVIKPSAAQKPLGTNRVDMTKDVILNPGETSHEDAKQQLKDNRFFDPTDKMIEGRVQMLAEGAEAPKDGAGSMAQADEIRDAIAKRARFDANGHPVVTEGYYNPVLLNPVNPDELTPLSEVVPAADSKVVGAKIADNPSTSVLGKTQAETVNKNTVSPAKVPA